MTKRRVFRLLPQLRVFTIRQKIIHSFIKYSYSKLFKFPPPLATKITLVLFEAKTLCEFFFPGLSAFIALSGVFRRKEAWCKSSGFRYCAINKKAALLLSLLKFCNLFYWNLIATITCLHSMGINRKLKTAEYQTSFGINQRNFTKNIFPR